MTASLKGGLRACRRCGSPRVPLLALVAPVFGGCAQVGTRNVTFWDVIWSMVMFFFWFMFIWVFVALISDLFRRNDISGGRKAIWVIVLIFLPLIGCLLYMAMRPRVTAQDVALMAQSEAAARAAASVSVADELAKLQQLKASGAITEPEFEALKAKAIGAA